MIDKEAEVSANKKPTKAPGRLDLAGLLRTLDAWYRHEEQKGVPAGCLIGENRFDLLCLYSKLSGETGDPIDRYLTMAIDGTYAFERTMPGRKVRFLLTRGQDQFRLTYPLRAKSGADNRKTAETGLPPTFIFAGLLEKSANNARRIMSGEIPIPHTWHYIKGMEHILFLAFFHTPVERLPAAHGQDGSDLLFLMPHEERIKGIVLSDTQSQLRFCQALLELIAKDDRFTFVPVSETDGWDSAFMMLMQGSEQTRVLRGKLQQLTRQLSEQYGLGFIQHVLGAESRFVRELNDQVLDWLREMLLLAMHSDPAGHSRQEPLLAAVTRRICLCVRQFPQYGAFAQLLLVACFADRNGKPMPYDRFNQLYRHLSDDKDRIVNELDRLIKKDRTDIPDVLQKMADALFVYQPEQDTVRTRFAPADWLSAIFALDPANRQLFVPAGWAQDEQAAEAESLRLYHRFDPVLTRAWFLTHPVIPFAGNGSDLALQTSLDGMTRTVQADFAPVIVQGYLICPPPQYAGICFAMQPAEDLTKYRQLSFSACSPDSSICQIKVEIKDVGRTHQDTFVFHVSDQWRDCSIDLSQVNASTRERVEEICFVVTFASFSPGSLTGRFNLRDIQVES